MSFKLLNLLPNNHKLVEHVQTLTKENTDLKDKLVKAQENLNKTNKYWKGKVYNLKNSHAK